LVIFLDRYSRVVRQNDDEQQESEMRKLLRRLNAYSLTTLNPAPPGPRNRPAGAPNTGPARRLGRQERRRIAAELAEYRTPAERLEIELILARYPADEVREIEELLPPRLHS
jgi:hypothetical protein